MDKNFIWSGHIKGSDVVRHYVMIEPSTTKTDNVLIAETAFLSASSPLHAIRFLSIRVRCIIDIHRYVFAHIPHRSLYIRVYLCNQNHSPSLVLYCSVLCSYWESLVTTYIAIDIQLSQDPERQFCLLLLFFVYK